MTAFCAVVAAFAFVTGATAQAGQSELKVTGAWMRIIMPSLPAAGYFTLSNSGATPHRLVGAASPACGKLMLHRSVNQNGQERMEMVKTITIPARGSVVFAPGGYHLMCMSPSKNLARGHSVPITLRLEDGEALTTNFPVRGANGK